MKISVIIIALNEEAYIDECLSSLKNAVGSDDVELLLVDGGSTDDTTDIARQHGIQVVQSEKCRGSQCRTGASTVIGDILVFLHGDSNFPPDGFSLIRDSFDNPQVTIATFQTRFDSPAGC